MIATTIVARTATFDTNILIYSIDIYSIDAAVVRKHRIAEQIVSVLSLAGSAVPLQCLNEFYAVVAKKRLMDLEAATRVVKTLNRAMDVIPPAADDLLEAMEAHQVHRVPFFDALLWATAKRAGCTTFLTEDFQDGRILGGVTFRNPFAPGFDFEEVLKS